MLDLASNHLCLDVLRVRLLVKTFLGGDVHLLCGTREVEACSRGYSWGGGRVRIIRHIVRTIARFVFIKEPD